MEQFLNQIPKPFLVVVALIAGIAGILAINPQYTACQAQTEIMRKELQQSIFGRRGQVMSFSPKVAGQISTCKQGNGPGGCFELFQTLRKVMREVRRFPESCNSDLAEISEIRGTIEGTMGLLVQVAWGDQPPENVEKRYGWFETGDVALFCQLRETYLRLYGEETLQNYQMAVVSTLPGEAPTFENGLCTNCETRKKAPAVMSLAEIYKLTLFSAPCSRLVY